MMRLITAGQRYILNNSSYTKINAEIEPLRFEIISMYYYRVLVINFDKVFLTQTSLIMSVVFLPRAMQPIVTLAHAKNRVLKKKKCSND